ncbi:MAG TPA: folylpolyglutamate synthase/dihydrofolate synthase family protein [Candidatus Sulfotelmatobacter sp.]|jgi:dihydrofolate synthase/folylpolyglutamate synthase|nr:folylpolyglutamate synthase/dihydrofolate synthase family protein [Candidatus Sulfotelmatobacter sp.]
MAVDQTPVAWLYALQSLGIKLGLEGIRALLELLDRPDRAFPILLVGGTNGKGSVSAMLDALFQAHGRRTGLYTSPHLVRPGERIRLFGADISPRDLDRLLVQVRDACERGVATGALATQPSFFEVMTAAALLAFRDAAVDLAVLEVGLGGRLDATNATEPVVSTIVTVDLDHTAQLGDTLAAIAAEKAGIIRRSRALVSGVRQREALAVLRARCATMSATFIDARTAVGIEDGPRGTFSLRTPVAEYDDLRLPLPGSHQRENARVAAATLEAAAGALGFEIRPAAVRDGLAATRWPGRLQIVPGRPTLLLDGAHNPAGAEALAVHLAERAASGEPKPMLLFGSMKDKDLAGMLRPLSPHVARMIATRPDIPRAMDSGELAKAASELGLEAEAVPGAAAALERARVLAGDDGLVLVAGSLYLIGEVLAALEGLDAPGPVGM